MDETKPLEPVYSGERTKTTAPNALPEETVTAEPLGTEKTATSSEPTPPAQTTALAEIPTTVGISPKINKTDASSPEILKSGGALPAIGKSGGTATTADFTEFLKRTKYVWLIAAGAIFGVMAAVTVTKRISEQARNARERRQEQAVLEVMPERLIERCGAPAEDVTKEIYPLVTRTMSYPAGENEKIVFSFSRTAEAKSEWVFLSMKDQSGAKSYDTPEAKIAVLPCLEAKK